MMISKKMAELLNEQVKNEFYAWYTYQAMAYVSESMNLKVYAQWFEAQAGEERLHAMKIARYLLDQGADVQLQSIPEPKFKKGSIVEVVQGAVDHELMVTDQIHKLSAAAKEENDYATANFLEWYVMEQVEEVATVTDLLNLTKMAESPGQMLMVEDRIMSLRGPAAAPAQ